MKTKAKSLKYIISAVFAVLLLLAYPIKAKAADITDSIYFFGDSTTAHLAVRGGIPKSRVWSGPDNTVKFSSVNYEKCVHLTTGETLTLSDAVKKVKPPILVITLGVSGGAGVLSENDFRNIYRNMLISVKNASPDTVIYVQSILPLSDKSVNHYKKITKEAVKEANKWIKDICSSLSVTYIDTHDLLTGDNGYLKPEYQNDEYMHLTSKAYEVVLNNIYKTVKNTFKE